MAMAPERIGIGIRRHFTTAGVHPYDEVAWERRDARITNFRDGSVAFEQREVEVPTFWSQNATNILAQKYFRGHLGTPERETSLKQVADRVADTIADWGESGGYFVDDAEAAAFRDELKYLIVHQRAAFNSPVWFNIGVKGVPAQASACQPWHAPVNTPEGLVPIGKLVEECAVGTKVYDGYGVTAIVAVKANGTKPVLRVHTTAGCLDVTADHLVWRPGHGTSGEWVAAGELRPGDHLEWHCTEPFSDERKLGSTDVAEVAIERIEGLGPQPVYDIQTDSGEYLSGNIRVHNCFILAVEDTMDAILDWYKEEGIIFKGGSGSGINLSRIRSSKEALKGGGTASGPVSFMRGADASAGTIKCLHQDTPVATDTGVKRIADVKVGDLVATRVGLRPVLAVHDNGIRPTVTVRTSLGQAIRCTPEHRFWVRSTAGEGWREASTLRSDDAILMDLTPPETGRLQRLSPVAVGHHNEIPRDLPSHLDEPLALWLGWIWGDGSVTTPGPANYIAVQLGDNDSELVGRYKALTQSLFGPVRFFSSSHEDKPDHSASVRFCSTQVIRFLEHNGLRKGHANDLEVPELIFASPTGVRGAFLAGLFEADGHIGNGYPTLSTVSPRLADGVRRLLHSLGIPTAAGIITDRRAALDDAPVHIIRVVGGEGVRRFAKLVGFLSERKNRLLDSALVRKSASPFETKWVLPHARHEVEALWIKSGQALRRAIAPYCRYANPRSLSLLRARALVDRFPTELAGTVIERFAEGREFWVSATVELSAPAPVRDLTVADVHEYEVHQLVTHNSGGKTRRAAKMVILNADHPDIEDFIWCKAIEERKARALRDAGFDMDLDGKDSHSIQYQNANNSVRVTDDFMQAVIDDADWHLRAATTGQVLETVKARDLFRQIAKAAWECADPGLQFDTTINKWHTAANTGRINASNPCCFVGETEVLTDEGPVPIAEMKEQCDSGDPLPLVRAFDVAATRHVMVPVNKAWVAGYTRSLVDVTLTCGRALRCTPEHRFLTATGAWVQARDLERGQRVRTTDGNRRVHDVEEIELSEEVAVYDLEAVEHHNFAVSLDDGAGVIVHNSEYVHLDNSACNLASINLLRFLREDDSFDVEGYKAAIEVMFTAQEILVGNADYPTPKIDATTRRFRQLGLGYANLGALLMAIGLPYDSVEGRAYAAVLTALMTGHAYATSARTAMRMGPFAGYTENREHMNRVLRMHRAAVAQIDEELVPTDLLSAAQESWDAAVELGEVHGVRNSQATVLAPTGCLAGGSLVATSRGLVRLRSLGDVDGPTWQDLGDLVVQTDAGAERASRFHINGLEPVVHVATTRGHTIRGTTKHRVKVVDPATGEFTWRRFADLQPGDLVPLALDQIIGEPQDVPLPPLPDAYWTSDHRTVVPRTMTPDLAELIGYFMGDGSLHSRGLRFCVTDRDFDVVERLAQLGKECFCLEAHVTPKRGYTEVRFDSVRLVLWWEACGFSKRPPSEGHTGKGYVAHIPDAVLHSNSRDVYAAFLRGLFEADGTVTSGYPHWMTTSLALAEDVQALLLALGYPTTRTIERKRTGWGELALSKLRLLNLALNDRWCDEVGFIGRRKDGKVTRGAHLRQAARQDHVPLTRVLVDRLCPANGRLRRVLLMELKRGTVSRRIATELLETTGDAELEHLLRFFYDRIESVELGEEELTYDLSVPSNVTYLANGFVSHNTISFLMDCDTTGIEPDLGLVKTKKLVGGGTMSIVNQTVPRALVRLGYTPQEVSEIVAHVDEHYSVVGAPHLRSEHLPVFACSMGDLTIDYRGHVNMVAAVQPFLSGSVSKTVNMPETVTVEDVEQLHLDAWRLGLKAVAIYRDNCKVAQPLSTTKRDGEAHTGPEAHDEELAAKVAQLEAALHRETVVVNQPPRERLPRRRRSNTFAFRVADCEGYVTVGEYADGRPGEVFMKVSKQGSTLAGIMDAFSISVSLGLQHGVPLATYVRKYTNMRFEPAGMTDDPDLRIASSLVDYIFRRLAVDYLPYGERAELGILTTGERMQPTLPGIEEESTPSAGVVESPALPEPVRERVVDVRLPMGPDAKDAPYCYQCGNAMQRAGSCYVCTSCGTTSGCS